ncbi:MAG: hypothetical protein NTX24_01450 [Candidatus Pacearchaeota archaeon]|nr:hypothetical protein [Candidatus Pacearchaeota archaeon]
MGTTTFYLRCNDLRTKLRSLTKNELEKFDNLSPYRKENEGFGWSAPLELHNGNVYVLVFWKGRLMKLEDAPKILINKYYDKYQGKTIKEYEWTLLKRLILNEADYLDKEFKKEIRKTNKNKIPKTKAKI